MPTKQQAQEALTWIQGEIPYIDRYLNGEYSDWPNNFPKLKKRAESVNEKLKVIFEYAREAEEK